MSVCVRVRELCVVESERVDQMVGNHWVETDEWITVGDRVCMFVWISERERDRDKERGRTERERDINSLDDPRYFLRAWI